jgi:hypothetical protein
MIVQRLDKAARVKIITELAARINDMPDEEFLKKVRAYFIRQYTTMPDKALQEQYNSIFKKK